MAGGKACYLLDAHEHGAFNIYERHVPAGKRFPLHWHDYLEFEVLVSGQMRHSRNDRSYLLEAGDAYIICHHDYHELVALCDTTLFCLHIRGDFLSPELLNYVNYNSLQCRFDERELAEVENMLRAVLQETETAQPLGELLVKNTVEDVLIRLIRKAQPGENVYTPLPIQRLIVYVNEHFTESLTLNSVATALSFSADHLGRLMKRQLGCTFNEYLNRLRLKHACRLLRHTNLTVKEVAFESGYASVEHFSYTFKKTLQLTPGEYRRCMVAGADRVRVGYQAGESASIAPCERGMSVR